MFCHSQVEKDCRKLNRKLNQVEQALLLTIARQAIEHVVQRKSRPELNLDELPPAIVDQGASFVTLTKDDRLRGCIGTLEAYQPLASDVQEHAIAAAFHDFRFTPVRPAELPLIKIEVSVLSPHEPLSYRDPEDLTAKLRPQIDGVYLQDGSKKATFLPQVWEQLPDAEAFLTHLCLKMGAPGDLWRKKSLDVFIYQVQQFHE